ncbi:MAG: hypothetical protein H7338_05240 [Candidatus Sericytochromatia bacterium]|nr:hypothetical protein [Candidatus Sericytochromatia bacterium]
MMKFLAVLISALLLPGCIVEQFSPIPFEWVDLNQDTYIVFDEYYYLMSSRMEATPPFDLQAQWYRADDNRDGIITTSEQWGKLFPPNTVYRARTTF